MVIIRDKRKAYLELSKQYGIKNDMKIVLNKNYSFYFRDLIINILIHYRELEIKELNDDVLYYEEILIKGV